MTSRALAVLLVALASCSTGCKRETTGYAGWTCGYEERSCSCSETRENKDVTEGCGKLSCCFRSTVPWEPHAATQYRYSCACHETDGGACTDPENSPLVERTTHCP